VSGLAVRLEHLWSLRRSAQAKRLLLYSLVSVITTTVSFVTLFLVFGVLHLWGAVFSTVLANLLATVPAYFLNRQWVWAKKGRSEMLGEIVPFWAMAGFGITVSMGGAAVARHLGAINGLDHGELTMVVLAANLVSFGVLWVLKFLLFNRLFGVVGLGELDDQVEALASGADGMNRDPGDGYDHI